MRFNTKLILIILILILFFILILKTPVFNSINLGTGDFRPYWSATYLLAHGQDFSNPVLMDQVERGLTDWEKSFTMMAWFAPTGMVVLLPLVLLPFEKAAFLWLLINITILSSTALLLWKNTNKKYWIPFLAIFGFPMTLLSLYVGQVNTLVLFGLTLYLSLEKKQYQYLRGFGLALTTIKPHLVILTLPLILFDCFFKKQWKILIGFLFTLIVSTIILTAFYPPWLISFCKLISSGMSTLRETPTISGWIAYTTGQAWGKWIWLLALLTSLVLRWFNRKNWKENDLISTLILGLLVSSIGWSYDQIVLLIPIIFLIKTILPGYFVQKSLVYLVSTLFVFYGIIIFMRINALNEVFYFWITLAILTINFITNKFFIKRQSFI